MYVCTEGPFNLVAARGPKSMRKGEPVHSVAPTLYARLPAFQEPRRHRSVIYPFGVTVYLPRAAGGGGALDSLMIEQSPIRREA